MRRVPGCSHVVLALLLLAACDDDALGPSSTVESVAVIPGIVSLVQGDTLRLTTIARDDIGNPLPGLSVVWQSSVPSVASVSDAGVLTGVTSGGTIISATIDGKSGTAAVTVSPRHASVAFAAVAAGGAHTCALSASGSAHCWGRGESGQLGVTPPATTCLGDLSYPCGLVPLPLGPGMAFQQLTGGAAHTCGLTIDGSAWCWGMNTGGQLGDGSLTTRNAPVAVATAEKFVSIDAATEHTCGLTSAGAAWCWGRNDRGQLGDGTQVRRLAPVLVIVPAGLIFTQVVVGGPEFRGFSCALASNGTAWCWGFNDRGQLGRGTRGNLPNPLPQAVTGNHTFASLAAGLGNHACGLTSAGVAHCWGAGSDGTLGDGSNIDSYFPIAVAGGLTFTKLALGGYLESGHTCGLTTSGAAHCWGDNSVGAVGDGSAAVRRTPTAVTGGLTFTSIAAGFRHTCARTNTGTVYCWGSGRTGQLGIASTSSSTQPMKVAGQL